MMSYGTWGNQWKDGICKVTRIKYPIAIRNSCMHKCINVLLFDIRDVVAL